MFAFLLITAGSAPLVAVALRWTKNHWRRPFSRVSELYAAVGLFTILWFIPLMALLPPLEGRRSLWVSSEFIGVPLWWDFFAVLGLVVCGLALLILSAIPDMAVLARHGDGPRAKFLRSFSGFWRGTQSQWNYHRIGLTALGAFYFMLLVMVQTMINVDFVMSLVPGWKDSIMPPTRPSPASRPPSASPSSPPSSSATPDATRTSSRWNLLVIQQDPPRPQPPLGLLLVRRPHHLLVRTHPTEQNVLKTFMFESYRIPFLLNFFFSFLIPFLLLMWNQVRKSIIGPTLAGASVLIGAFFMTIRLYVPALGIEDPTGHALKAVQPAMLPDVLDIFIILGGLAGAALIYLLASRIFPHPLHLGSQGRTPLLPSAPPPPKQIPRARQA